MNIIKLNAIDSTNSFLKELAVSQNVEDFTVVVAEKQLQGRGQRGNIWQTEEGKNLTFSVFVNTTKFFKWGIFVLNIIVPLSIIEALKTYEMPNTKIKWPNDILSDNKKIGGILIENVFRGVDTIQSVIGIGLNVNQLNFEDLPKASSMAQLKNVTFNKDEILEKIVTSLKLRLDRLNNDGDYFFWEEYHTYLFRKDVPSVFLDTKNNQFQAIIKGVTKDGKLILQDENEQLSYFDLKELTLLY